MIRSALPLLAACLVCSQPAAACTSVPGWSTEETYEGNEAIVVAELTSVSESRGADGSLSVESSFRVTETVRGEVAVEGTAVEVHMPVERVTPNADGVVYEIACGQDRILSRAFVGRLHLLFLEPLADRRWRVHWGSTAIPDPASPAGQSMLSEVRRLASLQRPQ
ncbi:hypothetical protein QF205_02800 [Luteimonas composti]|uniref:Lipoprotein n=1 Tax=Luteimonas composti TaxID=398257 RepID=A0ABT6MPI2_9GAMM|nr:hypothetical protein [Luteimonas composti]MDH7452008.1 hypothetical protein [Luteimonas composti]